MTDEIKKLEETAQKNMMTVYITSMALMAFVCVIVCMCMAYQSTATAKAYFGYEALPTTITNTQNNK